MDRNIADWPIHDGKTNLMAIDVMRPVVDEARLLTGVESYCDDDLAGQCVAVRLDFSDAVLFISVNGEDDSICVSSTAPSGLSDGSIHGSRLPSAFDAALGSPILWAWAMTNTQGRVDGVQFEFGTVDRPSVTIQMLTRASTLTLRAITAVW